MTKNTLKVVNTEKIEYKKEKQSVCCCSNLKCQMILFLVKLFNSLFNF